MTIASLRLNYSPSRASGICAASRRKKTRRSAHVIKTEKHNHIAENTICSATPEVFGYFSMMTQHFFWHVK